MILSELQINQSAKIISVDGEISLRCRLLDMGLIPKTIVTLEKLAPLGDPMQTKLRGYSLTLRKDDASLIKVELLEEKL